MSMFRISIAASGGHGCERMAKKGDRLFRRCGKFSCPDCRAYDFLNALRQNGYQVSTATFTHFPDTPAEVVDDMLNNVRLAGQF